MNLQLKVLVNHKQCNKKTDSIMVKIIFCFGNEKNRERHFTGEFMISVLLPKEIQQVIIDFSKIEGYSSLCWRSTFEKA